MTAKLLIVEDQPDIRNLIRATLEFEDFEIHVAEDGRSGLDKFVAVRPAIVLLGVMMPGELDGIQVCQRIKQGPQGVSTIVILLTARGQKSDVEIGLKAGADAYLVKPFSPLELIETVEAKLLDAKAA
jgi:two-component system, OmpR family, phosphate regulon response regulator PhoB